MARTRYLPVFQLALQSFKRVAKDESGATAITVGLMSFVLLGFAGLGTEVAMWYANHRALQNAVDSAALSGATANTGGVLDSSGNHTEEAKYAAAQYGFVDTQSGVTVVVNSPPQSGSYTTVPGAVEAYIEFPQKPVLGSLFLAGAPNCSLNPANNSTDKYCQVVRAVAIPATNGDGCVVTLDTSSVVDIAGNGNTDLHLVSCSLYVDSTASDALNLNGGKTQISADQVYVTGGISAPAGSITAVEHTGVPPLADPYSNLQSPTFTVPGGLTLDQCSTDTTNANGPGGADHTYGGGTFNSSTNTWTPDIVAGTIVFCNGFQPSGTVTLEPGLYVVVGGVFGCNSCTITGQNVTIFLTGSPNTGSYATLSFGGNVGASLTISAPDDLFIENHPTTQALDGIAIYQDRHAPTNTATNANGFTGNASDSVTGVIYFPKQGFSFNGNGGASAPICAQLVALRVQFNGNGAFANDCTNYTNHNAGLGLVNIGAIPATLVE